jgi:predicted outer membrane repeat protein
LLSAAASLTAAALSAATSATFTAAALTATTVATVATVATTAVLTLATAPAALAGTPTYTPSPDDSTPGQLTFSSATYVTFADGDEETRKLIGNVQLNFRPARPNPLPDPLSPAPTLTLSGDNSNLTGGIYLSGITAGGVNALPLGATYILGHDYALGLWADSSSGADPYSATTGLVTINSGHVTIAIPDTETTPAQRTIRNHFIVGALVGVTGDTNASVLSLTFDVPTDASLTFADTVNTSSTGNHVYGGAISVYNFDTSNSLVPSLLFTGGGEVTFSGNKAANGGAIGARTTSHSVAFDFSGLSTLTFDSNAATTGGGGAIYAEATKTISLNFGDSASFTNNTAITFGGAIHAGSLDTYSAPTP